MAIALDLDPEIARHAETIASYLRTQEAESASLQRAAVRNLSVVEWGERNFWIPSDSGRPRLIQFMPHQKIIMELFFNPKVAQALGCSPSFQTLVYSTCKKSGKTALSALVGRWICETWGSHSEVYALANDLEQSRGRMYAAALASIELDPRYRRADKGIKEQWRIIERDATYIPNHSVLRAVSSDYRGEAGSNPTATFWCVSEDTEILTKRGWLLADDVLDTDALAALLPDGSMRYEVPSAYNRVRYSGEMVHFSHRRADFLVTPNHRVYCALALSRSDSERYRALSKEYLPWGFASADWLSTNTVPKRYNALWLRANAPKGITDLSDAPVSIDDIHKARLYGYYIAEGCIDFHNYASGRRPRNVKISQDLTVHFDAYMRILDAIEKAGYRSDTYIYGYDGFTIANKELAATLAPLGLSHQKYVPDWIKFGPLPVQRAFLEAYLDGDGHDRRSAGREVQPTESHDCATTSERLANDLAIVGLHCGYATHQRRNPAPSKDNHRQVYRVGFNQTLIGQEGKDIQYHWSRVAYDGMVYCPSLAYGIFYIRRKGKTCWTGNSELWGFEKEASQRLFEELTPVPTRPRSIRYIDTYAGFEGESSILNELEDRVKKEGRRLDHAELRALGLPWPWPDQKPPFYVHRPTRTFAYWDEGVESHRMPWQTPEYYVAQAAELRQQAFERLHLNHRVSSAEEFVPREWWMRLAVPAPPLDKHTPVVVGADASVTGDCTALVAVSRDPNDHANVLQRLCRVWSPSPGSPLDYSQTIEPTIREWCKTYNVVELAYDQYQLHDLTTRLRNEGVVWCRPFSQMGDRMVADKSLYDLIRDQRIHHVDDPDLNDHIFHVSAKIPPDDNTRLRLIKSAVKSKIDAAVALSMAAYEVLRLNV